MFCQIESVTRRRGDVYERAVAGERANVLLSRYYLCILVDRLFVRAIVFQTRTFRVQV